MTKLLTVEQFAEALGMKPSTIRQRIWRQELEVVRIGRSVRFKPELVEKMIQAGTVPARESK